MARMFGTDGVRGVANTELTAELAMDLGKAAALVLAKNTLRPVIIIGRDTRGSGEMLEDALAAGILSAGGNVIKAGIIPTPGIAYLTREYGADAGVVISASHNPFQFNGIKFIVCPVNLSHSNIGYRCFCRIRKNDWCAKTFYLGYRFAPLTVFMFSQQL